MITIEQLNNLANLSRIKLDEEEKTTFIKEFDSILEYIDKLKKVEMDIDADSRLGAVRNVTRPDIAEAFPYREDILNEAPKREGDFYAVKKIIS